MINFLTFLHLKFGPIFFEVLSISLSIIIFSKVSYLTPEPFIDLSENPANFSSCHWESEQFPKNSLKFPKIVFYKKNSLQVWSYFQNSYSYDVLYIEYTKYLYLLLTYLSPKAIFKLLTPQRSETL